MGVGRIPKFNVVGVLIHRPGDRFPHLLNCSGRNPFDLGKKASKGVFQGIRTGRRVELRQSLNFNRIWANHSKFSVGCVATPTGAHPAAPVKLAGGVIAPAMA